MRSKKSAKPVWAYIIPKNRESELPEKWIKLSNFYKHRKQYKIAKRIESKKTPNSKPIL